MKFILKLGFGLLLPNLFLAYWLQNMIKRSEGEIGIMSNSEVKFMYFLSAMIVVLPICITAYALAFEADTVSNSFFFNYITKTGAFSLMFGIVASMFYLYGSNSFKLARS